MFALTASTRPLSGVSMHHTTTVLAKKMVLFHICTRIVTLNTTMNAATQLRNHTFKTINDLKTHLRWTNLVVKHVLSGKVNYINVILQDIRLAKNVSVEVIVNSLNFFSLISSDFCSPIIIIIIIRIFIMLFMHRKYSPKQCSKLQFSIAQIMGFDNDKEQKQVIEKNRI